MYEPSVHKILLCRLFSPAMNLSMNCLLTEQRRVNKKRQDKTRCDVMYIRLQGKVISHMLDLYIREMEI